MGLFGIPSCYLVIEVFTVVSANRVLWSNLCVCMRVSSVVIMQKISTPVSLEYGRLHTE